MARTSEVVIRGVAQQVGHAVRVKARVALDLFTEARRLALGLERGSPKRMERVLDLALERAVLRVHVLRLHAQPVDAALQALARSLEFDAALRGQLGRVDQLLHALLHALA